MKLDLATGRLAPHLVKWVPGQAFPTAAVPAVWASNIEPEKFNGLVMVVVSGTTKNDLATTGIAQFLARTQNSPNGVLAQFLACLLIILLKLRTDSTARSTEFLETVLTVLLLTQRTRNVILLLPSATECAL